MTVTDVIGSRHEIYSIRSDQTVHEAARYLREKHMRSIGVVDKSGHLIGVLSQSDISEKVVAENRCPAWIRVDEIMTRDLISVTTDDSVDACLGLLEHYGIHHLLVVDRTGHFHGMLSVTDLLKVVMFEEKSRADMLESFINSH